MLKIDKERLKFAKIRKKIRDILDDSAVWLLSDPGEPAKRSSRRSKL